MSIPLKFGYGLVLCVVLNSASAQQYRHFTLWSRLVFNKPLNQRWGIVAEVLYRQQNNYHETKANPLVSPLLRAGRVLVNYRRGNWTFTANPNFFYSYQLLGKEDDYEVPPGSEWRMAGFVENAHPLKKWTIRNRFGYEYRMLERNDWQATGRLRYRLQGRYSFSETVTGILSHELLFNVGPNKTAPFYNQNQALAGLNWRVSKHIGAEMGYLYLLRKRRNGFEYDHEHAINVALTLFL